MKILGLGDNVIDVYKNLNVAYPGGNAVNVAVNASHLGHQSGFLGFLADDRYGYFMKSVLKSCDVDISRCQMLPHTTTKLCVENVVDGEREFLKVDLGDCWCGPTHLCDGDIEYIYGFDAVLTSCNAKMPEEIVKLKDYQGILSYDFGEKEKYRTKDYFNQIMPYIDLAQFSMSGISIEDAYCFFQKHHIQTNVLITRGKKTPLFYNREELIEGVHHYVDAIDTMGAGDAYITAFVASLLEQGWHKNMKLKRCFIEKAMDVAARYASEVCLVHGGFGYPYYPKELKAVIFDMDGVIVDTELHWRHIFKDFLGQYGKAMTKEDERDFYGCSLEKEIVILGRYLDMKDDEIDRLKTEYSDRHPICYSEVLMEGVKDLLLFLKNGGISIAIASSSPMKSIVRMMEECDLTGMFDCIVSGEMFAESKPHPAIYEYTVDQLNIHKENILVIEDSQYGVEAASRANLDILALRNDCFRFDLSKAMLEMNSHKDILEYIEKVIL